MFNTTGNFNTALGRQAMRSNSSGVNNTAVGFNALFNNKTGIQNTALGREAGELSENVDNSTFIGFQADATQDNLSNVMALGYASRVSANNHVVVGNAGVTSIGGSVPWTVVSDGNFKADVREDVGGLAFIKQLRPVSYRLDAEKLSTFFRENREGESFNTSQGEVGYESALSEKGRIRYSGFIAQEVEQAAQAAGYDFSAIDRPSNDNDTYGLRYSMFTVPLVKAVQELSEENESLKEELQDQERRLVELEKQLRQLAEQVGAEK